MSMYRRIDDLGRLAIPKQMRQVLKVEEGQVFKVDIDSENNKIILTVSDEDYIKVMDK